MKVIRAIIALTASGVLVAGCGGSPASTPAAVPETAKADLLSLLPDANSYPAHLASPGPELTPRTFTSESIAESPTWNVFGSLVPKIAYEPAGCTATHNPDIAPHEGRPFALDVRDFEEKSKVALPTQTVVVGATVAQGTVDQAAVQALAVDCATILSGGELAARFEVLPNPKADPDQVFAISMASGKTGEVFKLTYVAQMPGYTVTTYAVCSSLAVCEQDMTPVFLNGIAKAKAAG